MQAIVQRGYGGPEVLTQTELPRPEATPDHVVIQVKAAAIDRGTWHLMTGTPLIARLFLGLRAPKNPQVGRDVAGVITEVGPGVEDFEVGQEVVGAADGSLAEFARVPVARLATKPQNVSFEQAAALPVSGITAFQAVETYGRVQPGARVLVLGASGGVGSYAVQLARLKGGRVTAVCSAAKAAFVRSLGAETVVAYDAAPLSFNAEFEVLIDIGGRTPVRGLRRMLTERGRAVIVGGEGGDAMTNGLGRLLASALTNVGRRTWVGGFLSEERAPELNTLLRHVAAGEVTPAIDRVLPFSEVQTAMTLLAEGQVKGKLVLTP